MKEPCQIFLVDDHVVVRNGLKSLIERIGPYTVTQEFSSGNELLKAYPFLKNPDLIILDIHMPGMDGRDVLEWMNKQQVEIPVLMLTLESDEQKGVEFFAYGIGGYLNKDCSTEQLSTAIHSILTTGYYSNNYLVKALSRRDLRPATRTSVIEHISKREMEFLILVCDERDLNYEHIAEEMGVHRRTVDGFRESLFKKFNLKSKQGLLLFALKHRLTSLKQA